MPEKQSDQIKEIRSRRRTIERVFDNLLKGARPIFPNQRNYSPNIAFHIGSLTAIGVGNRLINLVFDIQQTRLIFQCQCNSPEQQSVPAVTLSDV